MHPPGKETLNMKVNRMRSLRRAAGTAAAFAAATALAGAGISAESGTRASGGPAPSGESAGRNLYAKNCSSCHGESGSGDGPSGLFLKQKPADFRSGSVRRMSDDDLFSRITEGKQPMPGFGKKLSDEERWAVVHYVRQLAAGNP
jgi:mono/diheme cytochrome c family protein